MSLLVLMYHRAAAGRHGNPAEMLDRHFGHIARSYRHVLPGEKLDRAIAQVCLSFDDAYADFYSTAYPLLLKHRLRALLAVSPELISEEAAQGGKTAAYCSWTQLGEMSRSGSVAMAAHGLTHQRLDGRFAGLAAEIDSPKEILAGRLGQPVDSFVFPFGRFSTRSRIRAQARYRYLFRIGGAINRGWGARVLYRVDADEMRTPTSLFAPARMTAYRARYFWNRLRLR